ncbi:hypothetical protein [Flavobacterium sp. UBA6135]|uniref:hypothetical protein n=1 Tax=Flavobacterium sp. UBA6135 TaxID=1946553 RepID=UPI0025BA5636|nr:hypothetical protein [Flavobacterium sp. UBA6135]
MKKYILLFLLMLSFSSWSQTLNNYKYVIVPKKFNDFNNENQYRLNTITKFNLEKMGFEAFYEDEEFPKEVITNRCDALIVDVVKGKLLFWTKVNVVFKDCFGKIIYESKEGKSKEKEFKVAYPKALDEAFQSLFAMDYKYKGSKNSISKEIIEESKIVDFVNDENPKSSSNEQNSIVDDNSKILFAHPVKNGYQLFDSVSKLVFKLLKTDVPSLFLAQKGAVCGVVILKQGSWFFEHQENDNVVSEKINIKF